MGNNLINDVLDYFSPEARSRKRQVNNAVIKMVEAIRSQHYMYRKEIAEWRTATYLAELPEEPRRKRLMDLYKEIMKDAFIFGRAETRKLRVSNKKLVVKNADGDIDTEKSKLMKKGWTRKQSKYNIESIYYGFTLSYFKDLDDDGFIKSVDMVLRDHIVPETCEVLRSPEDKSGTRFDQGPTEPWTIFVNHTHTLGLLDRAAPLYIFKKHSWQNWDEFEERFGIPMRIAKVASQDKRVLKEIDKWLKDLGSAAYARFPEGTELDIKETSTQDAYNVFNEKRKACNEELATLFDGHFETAKDSGSRAKAGALIESNQDQITLDDEQFNLDTWNDIILPKLTQRGYPFIEGDHIDYDENVVSTPRERLEIFQGVKKLGYNVDPEQIESELDVRLVEPERPPGGNDGGTQDRIENFNVPHGHSCGAHPADYRIIDHNVRAMLSDHEERLLREIYNGDVNWNFREFERSHGRLLQGLMSGLTDIGTDFKGDDHRMASMMRANVHRFGMDKTTAEIFQLNEILRDPDVDSFEKFRDRALKVFPNYNRRWLRTEYDQAVLVGEMGQRYQEMIRDIDVAPYWRLVAVLDDTTTNICRSLDGKVFRKDNPETWRFLPPNHWKCRSDAEDVIDLVDDDEVLDLRGAIANDPEAWEAQRKSGHDVNWGDSGQVFSASQGYLKRVSGVPLDTLNFGYADFGLPKVLKGRSNAPQRAFEWEDSIDANGMVAILDNDGLPKFVNGVLLGSLEDNLANALPDVIGKPMEVYWMEDAGKMVYVYIKVYSDANIVVRVEFSRVDAAQVVSVEEVRDLEESRKGLLIYRDTK
ncbi:phage portal protein family protein [Spongiimicrobium salis]|uniref:phage portal protein family protein n=1 Tax=Spongiimicrobium salis TaxID=1667022 RepID=UPI00374D39B6